MSVDAFEADTMLASRSTGTLRPTVLLIGATGITLVGNLGVQVILARKTGASTYGAAGTLLAWSTIASTVAAGIQYTVTRTTSVSDAATVELLRRGLWAALPWLALAAMLMAVTPFTRSYLNLRSAWAAAATVGVWYATLAYAVPQGILVGRRNFGAVAILNVVGVALRYLFLFLMGWKSPDGITAITSLVFTMLAIAGLGVVVAAILPRRAPAGTGSEVPTGRGLASDGATGAVLATGLWIVATLPLVFARHFLPGARSGSFTVVQLLVGAILYTATPIVTVFYPRIAVHRSRRDIERAFAAVVALCTALVVAETAVGPIAVQRLYGSRYDSSRALFLATGVSVIATAVGTCGVWVCHALRQALHAMIVGVIATVIAEAVAGSVWHGSAVVLASGPAVATAIGAAAGFVALLVLPARPRSPRRPRPVVARLRAAIEQVERAQSTPGEP